MFVGLIFSFGETSTVKYKCLAIGTPYVFLLVDILSWWLTKLDPMFAWLVIFAGAGMAISFAFMWTVSVLEMWLFDKAFINAQGERYPQWSTVVEAKFKQIGGEDAIRVLADFIKRGASYGWSQWQSRGLPFVQELYRKILKKDR